MAYRSTGANSTHNGLESDSIFSFQLPRTVAVWACIRNNVSNFDGSALTLVHGSINHHLNKPSWATQWMLIYWDGANWDGLYNQTISADVWYLLTYRQRSTATWHERVFTTFAASNSNFSTNTSGSYIEFGTTGVSILLGRIWSSSSYTIDIAHAAVWDTALTDQEINDLAGGKNPSRVRTSGLLAYWPLQGTLDCVAGKLRPTLRIVNNGLPLWAADPPRVEPWSPRRAWRFGDVISAPPPPTIIRPRVAWFARA